MLLRSDNRLPTHARVVWSGGYLICTPEVRRQPLPALPTQQEDICWAWARGRLFTRLQMAQGAGVGHTTASRYIRRWLAAGRLRRAGWQASGDRRVAVFYAPVTGGR